MTTIRLTFVLLLVMLFLQTGGIASADTATFTLHKAMDPGSTPHLAVSYLIPKGWKASDTVDWDIAHRNAPLTLSFVDTSPDGKFIVRWLNSHAFMYSGNQGQTPPEHPSDVLVNVFKATHPGVDVDVIDRQETPTASIFKTSPQIESQAWICTVKMRYTLNGVLMLTKSGFKYDSYTAPRFHTGAWFVNDVTGITGPEAQFPKAEKLAAVVLSSRQWDPQFFEQYVEVMKWLIKQNQDEGQAYLNAQAAALQQHFHDLSESNRAAFEAQEAAKDENTRQFCDYVLDRERYTDGHTQFILPSGYKRAATNGTDYVVTDDPDYSPSGDWHELKQVK